MLRRLLLVGAASCASPGPSLAPHAAPLPAPPVCDEGADTSERLVLDWSPLDRSKLESAARRGLVAVKVSGCTARLVEPYGAATRYAYSPTSRQRESMLVRDKDELRAKLPLGAARFDASLERASALRVTMTVVGRYEAPDDAEPPCGDATHAVASIAVGSFEIAAATEAQLTAGADAFFAGAHAENSSERERLDSAGVEARCADARRTDTEPPADCAIPLRIELRRLRPAPRAEKEKPARATGAELGAVMAKARSEVAPCYRRALAADPDLHGSVTLLATVGPRGNVLDVSAKHDVPDALADCAIVRVGRLPFPPADAERPRLFVVPFVFNARMR